MKLFSSIKQAGKVTRTLGLFGLMAALVASFAVAPTAPASAQAISGKLTVYTFNAAQAGVTGISGATIVLADATGKSLMKGTTDKQGTFSSYVQPGVYTVKIVAQGFLGFSKEIKIEPGKNLTIQAGLTPVTTPPPSIDPMPTPIATSDPAPTPVPVALFASN